MKLQFCEVPRDAVGIFAGGKLECYEDKMREILPKIGWL